jgi:Fe-S-cluster containining protein
LQLPLLRFGEEGAVAMTEGPAAYDCQTCGACCANRTGALAYVRLGRGEAGRMRRLGLPVVRTREGNYLGTKVDADGRRVCAAFEGGMGGTCSCGVYLDRPGTCRAFEVGGMECREARRAAGLG